jgi:hypothetical protein
MVDRSAVRRATQPTPMLAKAESPKRLLLPTDTAPFRVLRIITGRSMKTVLRLNISSARL